MAIDVKAESAAQRLRRLPPHERDAILEAGAAAAEADYRLNPDLTSFDAFGRADLYGESSDAQCVRAP
jgi:hypothetical protein